MISSEENQTNGSHRSTARRQIDTPRHDHRRFILQHAGTEKTMGILTNDSGKGSELEHHSIFLVTLPRVTHSERAFEMDAILLRFDQTYAICHFKEEIMVQKIELHVIMDCKNVYNIISKESKTHARRIQIYRSDLRESYENGERRKLGWIQRRLKACICTPKTTREYGKPFVVPDDDELH